MFFNIVLGLYSMPVIIVLTLNQIRMKKIIVMVAIGALTLSACNNSSNKSTESNKVNDSSTKSAVQAVTQFTSPVNGLLRSYLRMKNALVNDNDTQAAKAAREMLNVLNDFDKVTLRDEEKKPFEDIADDAKEHAEHIGMNSGNIKHQRNHFDTLSKDMYDMIKKFAAGETIYVDSCPKYNDNKGAIWLSETMEIKNPYFGNVMPNCGKTTETIQ
jgi:Protein of unknown function (DUF3347)